MPSSAGEWTTARDIRAQLHRRWDRGELLRSLVQDERLFPMRLNLKSPDSAALTDRFEAVRSWVAELAAVPHIRFEWREVQHRVQGRQRLPHQIWVDQLPDALSLLGKRREAEIFGAVVALTRRGLPTLLPWLARRPLRALEIAPNWPQLLDVVRWISEHPRPGIYLRQVDLPGVHSKFVEAHRAVLSELLDLVLEEASTAASPGGIGGFAARYGFRDKPLRIRFRLLDPHMNLLPGATCPDVTLDAASFAALQLPLRRVFITENEINFLAFPQVSQTIVLFGAGYGWEVLSQADWLKRCALHYWGDIDTHGFAILDQLRSRFGQARSFLMDRETLLAHQAHWGEEPEPVKHDLPRLDPIERQLYDDLRKGQLGPRLRLEQERIGFHWVARRLNQVLNAPD